MSYWQYLETGIDMSSEFKRAMSFEFTGLIKGLQLFLQDWDKKCPAYCSLKAGLI